jgi:2-haloacid dehalogenase
MLRANMRRVNIEHFFEAALSTDRVRAFKPAPEAYRLGVEAFGLRKEEVAFAAFAAWDAAGASWFGYPTAWVNRLGQRADTFGASPTVVGRDLAVLNELLARPD